MKKILLIGCLLCANLQAQFYNFESAATGSSGISTATARQNTGWTSNGTTAQDTSAIYYLINGKYHRLIIVDTDNDSLILAPHALYPIHLKDVTTNLFRVDSAGAVIAASKITAGDAISVPDNSNFGWGGGTTRLQGSSAGAIMYSVVGNSLTIYQTPGKVHIGGGLAAADSVLKVTGGVHVTTTRGLRLGRWTIASDEVDRLTFSFDGTLRAEIDSSGNYVDLFAGLPPTGQRYQPPQEYIWLLRIVVALLSILIGLKLYETVKPKLARYRQHGIRAAEL